MRKIFSLSLLALSLIACSSENLEDLQVAPCDSSNVTYSAEVQAILTNNCTDAGCHVGPGGVGGLDLRTYSSAKKIADNGDLVGRITGTSGAEMPPTGKLSNCQIEKIKAWVQAGAQNN